MKFLPCDYSRRGSAIVGTTLAHPIGESQWYGKSIEAHMTDFKS